MDDNALDVARFLLRQPARRLPLRERALPGDVREVIDLASGAAGRLAEAAAKTGDTPAEILEATRFYVREILLYEGADAYRVLGVAPDASADIIKSNFRALQTWLHPDRTRDAWDIGYATRINTAWGALRSPERRAAYDAQMNTSAHGLPAGVVASPAVIPRWQETLPERSPRRNWLGLGAALVAGTVLAALALRQSLAPPPEWPRDDSRTVADSPSILESDPAELLKRVTGKAERAPPAPTASRPPIAAESAKRAPPSAIAEKLPPVPTQKLEPLPATAPLRLSPEPLPVRSAETVVAAPAKPSSPQEAAPARPLQPAPLPAVVAAPAVVTTGNTVPPVATAAATQEPQAVTSEAPVDLVERISLVHRRGTELTGYLTGRSSRSPPIWKTVAAQDAAATIRTQLVREVSADVPGRKSRLGNPVWQVSAERATMTSKIAGVAGDAQLATLRVHLAWQGDMWLVHAIEAENL